MQLSPSSQACPQFLFCPPFSICSNCFTPQDFWNMIWNRRKCNEEATIVGSPENVVHDGRPFTATEITVKLIKYPRLCSNRWWLLCRNWSLLSQERRGKNRLAACLIGPCRKNVGKEIRCVQSCYVDRLANAVGKQINSTPAVVWIVEVQKIWWYNPCDGIYPRHQGNVHDPSHRQ